MSDRIHDRARRTNSFVGAQHAAPSIQEVYQ
jgi:hypothetical protein